MASQSRDEEWDPMQEDFDNTNYPQQYGDEDSGALVKLDHKRLYITNIPLGLSTDGLKTAVEKYGNITEVFISTNPLKRFGLVTYETAAEARLAMTKLNKTEPLKLNVNIAHEQGTKKKMFEARQRDKEHGSEKESTNANKNRSGMNANRSKVREKENDRNEERGSTRSNRYRGRERERDSKYQEHERERESKHQEHERERDSKYQEHERERDSTYQEHERDKDDRTSVRSDRNARRQEHLSFGDNNITMDDLPSGLDDDMNVETTDPELLLELDQLRMQKLKLQQAELEVKQRMLLRQAQDRRPMSAATRCVLPGGKVVVRKNSEGISEERDRDPESSVIAGAGDSNERDCTCRSRIWKEACSSDEEDDDDGSSTPSTCKLCSCYNRNNDKYCEVTKERCYERGYSRFDEKRFATVDDRSDYRHSEKRDYDKRSHDRSTYSKYEEKHLRSDCKYVAEKRNSKKSVTSKTTDLTSKKSDYSKYTDTSRKSRVTDKNKEVHKKLGKFRSDETCDLKYSDFYSDSDDEADETNRLIQLRNSDYMDIVEDNLKIVIALAGYPKCKIRLRQMERFQKCLSDIIDMQVKSGLVKKMPTFMDYYLNRGAIVCICKDVETRDWIVRISPGLQERMCINLILLKSKVKRLCLGVLKIPRCCWPASAQDAFKLLQYFNPTLKTEAWKIYAQKMIDNIECTSFLIDRVSGEIIRGPTFKNVIDYNQMEFELNGYTEIYYECLLSEIDEDLSSVASRVKLLDEIKSAEPTPRNKSSASLPGAKKSIFEPKEDIPETVEQIEDDDEEQNEETMNVKSELECSLQKDVLKKLKDVKYISEKNEVIIWSDDAAFSDQEEKGDDMKIGSEYYEQRSHVISTSGVAVSDKTESIYESNDNLTFRNSNLNIDSNRGIAYHRRTNYLHVENELKVAITLEGYPKNKLEGTHIRRLKHLFKEYLHKDMKNQRFANLIIPKFQDIYLSNGAVIYVCDSLETKDYLTEVLPKFVNSTGLKLTFRDIKDLVRYTRIVMRLPKEHANVESVEVLLKLQVKYPNLKPDCWKYYSDVAGKQKRQFGVDPESLEVIKNPDFDPTYEGEKISFRIIDRQKRDVSFEEPTTTDTDLDAIEQSEVNKVLEKILKSMYVAIDPDIMNAPLTRIRTNHYSDLIPDDLKLYVGPSDYPESRIDDALFHTIKRTFEKIVRESIEKGDMNENSMPKFHDMYLFDGVIFIICQNMPSRHWIEQILKTMNSKLHIHLKSTEFRGAVGIISMAVKTDKDTDEIIKILQKQNPRLRTKYWRKISTVRTKTKLDVVLQIDKLSAQVMTSDNFNKYIGSNPVQFKLGHLQSLIKPKASLEELTKIHAQKRVTKPRSEIKLTESKSKSTVSMQGPKDKSFEQLKEDIKREYPYLRVDDWAVVTEKERRGHKVSQLEIDEESAKLIEKEDYKLNMGGEKLYFYTGLVSDRPDVDQSKTEAESPKVNKYQATEHIKPEVATILPDKIKEKVEKEPMLHKSEKSSEQDNQTLRDSTSVLPELSSNQKLPKNSLLSNNSSISLRKSTLVLPDITGQDLHKMILKIPLNILPDNKEDLAIIFDLLEDKNPGLNTELWQVYTDSPYPNNGKFTILTDKQSASIIEAKNFDPTIGGEKLRFFF